MPAEGGVGRQVRSRRPCRIGAAGAAGDASGGAEGETQRGRRERTGGGGEERYKRQRWQRLSKWYRVAPKLGVDGRAASGARWRESLV